MLYDNFKKLNNVPVGIDLQSKKLWGIAGGENKTGAFEIVDDIIAQIAANISYTDVKIAFCFDEKEFEDKTGGIMFVGCRMYGRKIKTRDIMRQTGRNVPMYF